MKKRIFRRIVVSLLTILTVSFSVAVSTQAQTADSDAAQGLQISPAIVELNAERGKSYTVKLNVMNVTPSALEYTASVNDFTSKDETGSPNVLLDSSLPPTASITSWLSVPADFILQSRESREVMTTVTIPGDAEPGGHYGVLRFSGYAPELDSTGVGLSASTGMLLLVRVAGDITEQANLETFFTADGENQTSFFEYGPVNLVARIKNEGNIHVKPVGTIEIHDMFGNLVITLPVNDTKSSILPNSIRRYETLYDEKNLVGYYTASLTLGYGTTGQAITATTSFWVIPYKIVLVGLAVLVTLVFVLRRLIKVYNKRIISNAIQKNGKKDTTKGKKK